MIILTGTVTRLRNATFRNGKTATFAELLVEHPDRAEIIEVLLPDEMDKRGFEKGVHVSLSVTYSARNDRAYCSATRVQPADFPKFHAA